MVERPQKQPYIPCKFFSVLVHCAIVCPNYPEIWEAIQTQVTKIEHGDLNKFKVVKGARIRRTLRLRCENNDKYNLNNLLNFTPYLNLPSRIPGLNNAQKVAFSAPSVGPVVSSKNPKVRNLLLGQFFTCRIAKLMPPAKAMKKTNQAKANILMSFMTFLTEMASGPSPGTNWIQ